MMFMKKRKILFKKPIIYGIAGIIILGAFGSVGALNGWFGGGGGIPEDTFTRGLVGYWSFDERQGTTAADASGNGNHGTLYGPSWTAGKDGGALSFDGTDDYVDLDNPASLQITDDLTIEFWVKFNSEQPSAQFANPIGKDHSGTHGVTLQIDHTSGTLSQFWHVGHGSGLYSLNYSSASLLDDAWHHLVLTKSITEGMTIYLDGQLAASNKTYTNPIAYNSGDWNFGRLANITTRISKMVGDELRFYSRALSAEEVRYHYNRGGPVAHWKFDEGSGSTVYDSTDNNNDGTLYGEMATSTTHGWTTGKRGSALSFDGTDDYVRASASSLYNPSKFTVSFWMYPREIGGNPGPGSSVLVVANGAMGTEGTNWWFEYWNSGYFDFKSCNPSCAGAQTQINTTNKWYFITGIYDGSKYNIYIDGKFITSGSGGLGSGDKSLLVGSGLCGAGAGCENGYFNGLIDDVRIYNYARTADEIKLDYNAGFAARFGPQTDCDRDPAGCIDEGLVSYWSFDERSGITAADASGNGNDGTVANGTTWTTGVKPFSGGISGGSALQFDGVDDYVGVSYDASLQPDDQISVEAWIKPASLSGNQTVISTKESGGYAIVLNDIHSDKIWWSIKAGGSYTDLQVDATELNVSAWNHLVGIYDGSKTYFYINGVLKESSPKSGSIDYDYSNAFFVAAEAASGESPAGNYFNGSIDEVRVYSRGLSATEVRYHYNKGGPVAHWKFDEGSGSMAYDVTLNGNNGTLYGEMATSTSGDSGWATGKYGSALSFDGVDDYMEMPTGSLDITNAITVEAWVKTIDSGLSIYNRGRYFSGNRGVALQLDQFWLGNDSDSSSITWDSTPAIGEWVHLAGVWDGKTAMAFMNGIKQTKTETLNGPIVYNGDRPGIGVAWTGCTEPACFALGLIDDVRIYDYARTLEQIRQDYNSGFAARFGPQTDCDRDPAGCMDDGLVGYWSFDERSGTTASDASNNNNDGTLVNGTTWATGIKPFSGGVSGSSAVQFDGTDDYVVTNSVDLTAHSAGAFEFWIKVPTDINQADLVSWHKTSGYSSYFSFYMAGGNGKVYVVSEDESSEYLINGLPSSDTVNDDSWHHIVFSQNGEFGTIYIDAKAQPVTTSGYWFDDMSFSNQAIYIGKAFNTGNYLNGYIDELRIYNRALSAAEVRYHYNKGAPVAHWKFDEGSGSTAYDSTANGNHGTLTNGPIWTEGKHGSALSFDGENDYVEISNGSSLNPTTFTLELWAYFNSLSGEPCPLQKGATFANPGYAITINNSHVRFNVGRTGGESLLDSQVSLATGKWYHIVAIYDGIKQKIYVDGVKDPNEATPPSYNASSENLWIGTNQRQPFLTFPVNGSIDDVRIYNYARTPEQILQDYNAGLSTYFK